MFPSWVNGQFLNIQIDVDPQVDSVVEQPLDFGQIVAGAGLQEIVLGSPNMGIFHIRALRTQKLYITMDHDVELRHPDPQVSATIPIDLYANYTNFGIDNYRDSVPMSNTMEPITIEGPPQNPQSTWSGMYIYIYGAIDLGVVPAGRYRGELVLTIIYE